MNVIIATKNNHKLEEMLSILDDMPFSFLSLKDFPDFPDIVEDGKSFEENAVIKATYTAKNLRSFAIGDDSGLVIDALNGAPGIFSSRYAENPQKRIERVLYELKNIPDEQRSARFVCCAVIAYPDGRYFVENGVCEGRIIDEQRGVAGFGYDPIFYIDKIGKTMAELNMQEKNIISHRGIAFEKIKKILLKIHKDNINL